MTYKTYKENITAILECYFTGFKKEIIDSACNRILEQQPCEDIAQERYKDLCEYFGGAKDILKSREDFKAWLGRVRWHIRKAEELYEKYEYKQEPCEDAISRDAVLNTLDNMDKALDENRTIKEYKALLKECYEMLPSVTQKCEKCAMNGCGSKYCDNCRQKSGKWIPVSEPPKELGTYLIQTDGEPYMCQCRWTDVNPFWTYLKTKPHWNIFDLQQYSKVVAWMPLPKPYEPQKSDKDACKDCYYNDGEVHAECVICDKAESEDKE